MAMVRPEDFYLESSFYEQLVEHLRIRDPPGSMVPFRQDRRGPAIGGRCLRL
jgi:hypothetical protein